MEIFKSALVYLQKFYKFHRKLLCWSLFSIKLQDGSPALADTDFFRTSWKVEQTRCRHDVWKKTSDLCRLKVSKFTTSWRRQIYDVFWTSGLRGLEDVWSVTVSGRLVYDVLKTSDLRRLEDVQFGTPWNVWFTMSSRCLTYGNFKNSDLCRLEDIQLTTSWIRLIYDVLKTSVKRRLWSSEINGRKKWFFHILYCLKYSENFKFSSWG